MPAPNTMPNLAAWFVGGVGITSAAGAISQWNDQSGNGRHLVQATGASQPALQADGSILFDGVDDSLATGSLSIALPITCYLLLQQVSWTGTEWLFDAFGETNSQGVAQVTASPTIKVTRGGVGSFATGVSLSTGTYGVVAFEIIDATNLLLQLNKGAAITGTLSSFENVAKLHLGADGNGFTFSNIQVKEVILFSVAHDATTRAGVIDYLNRVQPSQTNFVGGERRAPYHFTPYIPRRKRRY